MKNIHLIPTDKPSRLVKNINNELKLTIQTLPKDDEIGCYPQHIYITSDEEIKERDWYFFNYQIIKCENPDLTKIPLVTKNYCKKIILTTDPELIKDNVQVIDDTFLEWFVKNPSCEEVKIANDLKYFNVDELRERHLKGLPHLYSESIGYKIIILQEEPKQIKCYCGHTITCDCEPLQKTLEEANWKVIGTKNDTFYNGAKWQSERMYSEEEVLELLRKCHFVEQNIEEWFEQFKKNRVN
jgi:hypothetical protein